MRVGFGWALGAAFVVAGLLHGGDAGAHRGQQAASGVAACTKAEAARAGKPYDDFQLGHIGLALCGAFLGPGSSAMVVTFGAPTCWPIQSWAVFGLESGSWKLVKKVPSYLEPPLVAVGDQIRETTPVHRAGDPRCVPSGGTHARLWHWNGHALVAGPWKQVKKPRPPATTSGGPIVTSPSGNIVCWLNATAIGCLTRQPRTRVIMDASGRLTVTHAADCGCVPDDARDLGYGRSVSYGGFGCLSGETGMQCTVVRTGRGFMINRAGVHRIG